MAFIFKKENETFFFKNVQLKLNSMQFTELIHSMKPRLFPNTLIIVMKYFDKICEENKSQLYSLRYLLTEFLITIVSKLHFS
jgi:hypothetical protein